MKTFLGSKLPDLPAEDCLFHIIPAPYEKIVAYGGGAGKAPAAILDASQLLETFDGTSCPSSYGIYTHKAQYDPDFIERTIAHIRSMGGIPILLGGEQGVTRPAMKQLPPHAGIIHFDAHPDLKPFPDSDPFHHSSVLTYALENEIPLFQIGIRSSSLEEAQLQRTGTELPAGFPDNVYLSIDVSVLDPSLMPATRRPEPGGLGWAELTGWFERIVENKTVIGIDLVELTPINGMHAPDYLCARLVYHLMGLISRK